MRFQNNNGLYAVGIVLTVLWTVIISLFPRDGMEYIIPTILLVDLGTMGLFFMGAIIYFEKGQGTVNAIVTTPLTSSQYIKSKTLSLSIYVVVVASFVAIISSLIKEGKIDGIIINNMLG